MTFSQEYLVETATIAEHLEAESIERLVEELEMIRTAGHRVFVLGLGGSAANAQHCVNDLRVRGGLEAYTPELSEWTARANDQSWETALRGYLEAMLDDGDAVLVLSGSGESRALVNAMEWTAINTHARRLGILGASGSTLGKLCEVAVVIPVVSAPHRAGHAEAFQAVVWHCVVAHPRLAG